jgi:hypothetical protein
MRNMNKAKRLIQKASSIRNYGGSPKLVVVGDIVYSYNTAVAVYIEGSLYVPTWYSTTTSRHINKIAEEWNCEVIKDY